MQNSTRVLVSILNWNDAQRTIACLQALHASTFSDFDVLLIDNGSDGSDCEQIASAFPQIRLLRNARNEGFAGGHNRAVQIVLAEAYEAIWILNNDAVPAPETLLLLIEALRRENGEAALSPIIYYSDGAIQFCGGRIDWVRRVVHNFSAESFRAVGGNIDMGPWSFLWGTALLIGRPALRRIGFFDADFFAYFEDADLSVRAHRAGVAQKMVPAAAVRHDSPASMWERPPHFFYFMTRNEYRFWAKYLPRLSRWRFALRFIANALRRAAHCRDMGKMEECFRLFTGND